MTDWAEQDEQPHQAGADAEWVERWSFDFAARDGTSGGLLRFERQPGHRRCVVWAQFVHDRWGYVLVREDELPDPGRHLEVRGSLWAAAICEEPLSRWTLGLEAFGVQFDPGEEPEAWGREFGAVMALGFDLSFDDDHAGTGGGRDLVIDTGYVRSGRVTGDVLVGENGTVTTLDVDAVGLRRHQWGVPRATSFSWCTGGDGTGVVEWLEHPEMLPRDPSGQARTDGRLTPLHHAPVRSGDPVPGRVSRALGRTEEGGVGWLECWYPHDGR